MNELQSDDYILLCVFLFLCLLYQYNVILELECNMFKSSEIIIYKCASCKRLYNTTNKVCYCDSSPISDIACIKLKLIINKDYKKPKG